MFYNLLSQPILQKTQIRIDAIFDSLLMSPPPQKKISKIVYLPKTKWANYIVGTPPVYKWRGRGG